jgi:hypothetical protein
VTRAKVEPGAGKSMKREVEDGEEKLRKRKRREERREWRRALQAKESEYWDTMYDRGRRLVFGMGLPHDPLRGIQLLRRTICVCAP